MYPTAADGIRRPEREAIVIVVGTRPELIKLASFIKAIRRSGEVAATVVFTGQHTDLVEEAAADLGVVPDLRIAPLPRGRGLTDVLANVVRALGALLQRSAVGCVVVQGDTVSSLAGAVAAELMGVPLVHIEAGVRSRMRDDPFPEETIRRMISSITELHICFGEDARANLLAEGIDARSIMLAPHPLIDHVARMSRPVPSADRFVLVTLHRRERRRQRAETFVTLAERVIANRKDLTFRFVWHPGLDLDLSDLKGRLQSLGVLVLEPLPPQDFLELLGGAAMVLTDSAGVSEEAVLLGKMLVVLRSSAESRVDQEPVAAICITESADVAATFVLEHIDDRVPVAGEPKRHIAAGAAMAAQVEAYLRSRWVPVAAARDSERLGPRDN